MKMKNLLAAALAASLAVSGLVLPLCIFEKAGITALAAEDAESGSMNVNPVLDREALVWQGTEVSNPTLDEDEGREAPSGYTIETGCALYAAEAPLSEVSNSCGANLVWSLEDGTLTISGTGEMEEYIGSSTPPPWRSSKDQITKIVVESGVTKISAYAFADCCNLSTVALPDTLTSVGEAAFYGCTSLKKIALPAGVQEIATGLFVGCTALTDISAPGAVSVNRYAFQDTNLTSFTVGRNMTSIDAIAFYKVKIEAFNIEPGNSVFTVVDGVLFSDEGQTLCIYPGGNSRTSYTIPSTVKKVGKNAFNTNSRLAQIIIPEGVTELGESAFQSCSALKSIEIPDSVTDVGYWTFYECVNLESVKFGNGLKRTSYQMFEYCSSLKEIEFGSALEEIYGLTFAYCRSLEDVELPSNIKEVVNGAFGECTALKSFTSHGLTSIPYQTFLNDWQLASVNLNEGVTDIYRYAFWGCTKLLAVTLPASVKYVDSHAFETVTQLTAKNPKLGAYGVNGLRTLEYISISGNYYYSKAFEVLDIVNQRRKEAGLPELVMNSSLLETAMQRAAESSVLFSHTRPDGSSCLDLNDLMYGENLSYGSITAEEVMERWMNSDGHRQNILGSDYTTVGIGCVVVDGSYYWAQCFGNGKDNASCARPADRTGTQRVQIATETFKEASITSGVIIGGSESYTYTCSLHLNTSSTTPGKQVSATYYLENPGLGIGIKIGAEDLAWNSTNTAVATVSNGIIATIGGGNTEITATMLNGFYRASAEMNVGAIAEGDLTYSDGNYYFYEDGEMALSKEAFVNGEWRWFDADGTMAMDKDVYQVSSGGKWVRYDEKGAMVKGEDYRYGGWYYFEPVTGTMMKGPVTLEDGRKVFYDTINGQMLKGEHNINGQTYYFDENDGHLISGQDTYFWVRADDKDFWYEDWQRQGWNPADEAYRGKEIYDPASDAWYWLDNVQHGGKAVSKDVYQESYSAYPDREDGTGKWVRYDENGHMVKGWQTTDAGTYYFEEITGAMAKGQVSIDGETHYFDVNTGIQQW